MSSYVFTDNATFDDCPQLVIEYLKHLKVIKDRSSRTVNGYYIDLKLFFRFVVQYRAKSLQGRVDNDCDISGLDVEFFKQVTKSDIYEFLYFMAENHQNSVSARARKLSAIKGFYKFLVVGKALITQNPAKDIDTPAGKKTIPKYLTLEESRELLTVGDKQDARLFCILVLFLNCGMRLSELCGINISAIGDEKIRIIGKGRKERFVFLNKSCKQAIDNYIEHRAKTKKIIDEDALFISERTGKRLTARRVQQLVEQALQQAGLSGKGFSAHKLRHTAATLLYRYGDADMLALKEILGHAHVSTTEIYTHISDEQLKKAATSSPLSDI